MEQRNENKTELKMIKMSDVQSQTVDWLWYPFIPYGKLTIIQGDPGGTSLFDSSFQSLIYHGK